MQQKDATELIRKAITTTAPQHWADLGCGAGMFTHALASLLPDGSLIQAVDKKPQQFADREINFHQADIVHDELLLTGLDCILMANAFHYVKDKAALIKKLEPCFTDTGRFLIVEYETSRSSPWIPYPIPFEKLSSFFSLLGYRTDQLADHPSAFGGRMYAALVAK